MAAGQLAVFQGASEERWAKIETPFLDGVWLTTRP
jgi:hypothetical protein